LTKIPDRLTNRKDCWWVAGDDDVDESHNYLMLRNNLVVVGLLEEDRNYRRIDY
jgi:hypothetical protein